MVAAMGRQLWDQVRPVRSDQRFLYWVGAALVVSGVAHLVVHVVDGGAWYGAVSWRKPVVFGLSFGTSAWAVGWVLGQLPARRVLGRSVAGALGVASLLEVGLITLQRWRGVPSHFNLATSFDGAVFSLMGTSVAVVAVAILVVAGWALLGLRREPAVWWTSVVGLGPMLAGSGIGGQMIAGGHAVLEATGQSPRASSSDRPGARSWRTPPASTASRF